MNEQLALIGDPIQVPANASRFFPDAEAARRQPVAQVQLAWHTADSYLINAEFDASLIAHDESYCTSVVDLDEIPQVPTSSYFSERVLPHLRSDPSVVDIGCGQGEFVGHLRSQGVAAVGYDPVVRTPDANLHARYWTVDEPGADLFVMRCVLPHIPRPWAFVEKMGVGHPNSLLLVEFQRLEWIIGSSIWYQLSHDHVNLFSVRDFRHRFDVVDDGTFSNGEWGWALLRLGTDRSPKSRPCPEEAVLHGLLDARRATVAAAERSDRPLVVWGAAGKGIVLAHALRKSPLIAAVDADPLRHDKFMEVSGLPILGPNRAVDELPEEARVLVANPNHLDDVRSRYGTRWDVCLPSDLVQG